MSFRSEVEKGPAVHRDFPSPSSHPRGGVEPLPWTRLSRADCMLLALALHRSSTRGREAALNTSELFAADSV